MCQQLDQFPRRRNADGSPVPTMLEYIYTLLESKEPETLEWTKKLSILGESVTIDLNIINANLRNFETKIDLLYDRLQSADETQFSGKNFVHKMQPFYDDSCKQLSTFQDAVKRVNKELKALGAWFDVEDGDNLEFLKQLNSFRTTFEGIGPRLINRAKEKERKSKRAQKKGRSAKKKRVPKPIDSAAHTLVAKGTANPPGPRGGVPMPGFARRG